MGGPNSAFNQPFAPIVGFKDIKDNGPLVGDAQNRQVDLINKVRSEADISDADREKFLNELVTSAEQFKKDIQSNKNKVGVDQFFGDIQGRFNDTVAVLRKKRLAAEKERQIQQEAPGSRISQNVNSNPIAAYASPLTTPAGAS